MADAWRLFMGLATQWKVGAGLGGAYRTGLDYTAIEPVARALGLHYPLAPQTFADLRLMEAEALSVWSRQKG